MRGIALFGLQAEENKNSEHDIKVRHFASGVAHFEFRTIWLWFSQHTATRQCIYPGWRGSI